MSQLPQLQVGKNIYIIYIFTIRIEIYANFANLMHVSPIFFKDKQRLKMPAANLFVCIFHSFEIGIAKCANYIFKDEKYHISTYEKLSLFIYH